MAENNNTNDQQSQGMFDKKKQGPDPLVAELREELKKLFSSIRTLEDKIFNLDKKASVLEENLLLIKEKLNTETKILHTNVIENEKDVLLLKKSIMDIVGDMKNFARVEEVSTLRKYLEMWQPLNFVTRNELNEIFDERQN